MRVFVTGATGFIGSRTVLKLLSRGHEVTALVRRPGRAGHLRALGVRLVEGDVTRGEGLAGAMAGSDALLHLANHYSLYEPNGEVFDAVNVLGNRNVMAAALKAGVGRAVHVSSGASYGASPDQPLREDSRVGPFPNAYWRTKHQGDQVVWDFHGRGLPVTVVYPGAVLGPNDPKASGIWIRNIMRGLPVRAFESSGYTWVHVDDVAQAIVRAAEHPHSVGERYLVGREYLTHGEFAQLVAEVAGTRLFPVALPDWMAYTSGAVLGTVAKVTGTPPLLNFSLDAAAHLAYGFRFGSDKAERELGLTYTPVRQAIAEEVASLRG